MGQLQVFRSSEYAKAHAGAGLIERSYRIFRNKKTGGEIFGGQYPLSRDMTETVFGAAEVYRPMVGLDCVDLFIDLTSESLSPYVTKYDTGKIRSRISFPIRDDYPPSDVDLREFLAAIDFAYAYASAGRVVYVHCRGGIGRTGTFAAAFLMRRFGASVTQALVVLRELRNRDLVMSDRSAPEVRQVAWLRKNAPKLRKQT